MTDESKRHQADELEIRNLIARFAQLADNDSDDLREYLSLITEDGSWESRTSTPPIPASPPRRGHAEIRAGVIERRKAGIQGPNTNTLHTVTTTVVKVHGDTAEAKSYFIYLQDTESAPRIAHSGAYNDEFRRTPSGWKFSRRVLSKR